ncbi:helix-turn-helix transcriptional regulator [Desulforamulus ruminis]|uniref:Helix-turn-helix-domain containing protein AraC type n=1 Tax=Desulforamulus ruminis (strain ATCC 23193 / DSM 2154 / NCIMB 8452 / DL) TaxID=696281 RepID=F6DQR9_DESRL|nr:AraC family transcriptional regulator [Desulforamulus ruminis]AEG62066.1 helix-turn-helix- domain containing protein AraC type [Desulforamulus ruminis DSM 2154]
MNSKLQIQNSIDYIEKNLCENIKLSEIARQSHFSQFHFHRLFHKTVGTSVMDYVRKRRLSEAAMELAETDEKITNIAFKYQFSSEESFSRAFKKLYGASPRDYRNTSRKISRCGKAGTFIKGSNGSSSSNTTLCRAA